MGVNTHEKKLTIFGLPEKAPTDSSRSEHARGSNTAGRLSPGVRGTALRKSQGPWVSGSGWVGLGVHGSHLIYRGQN